jgi:hypothetical protein
MDYDGRKMPWLGMSQKKELFILSNKMCADLLRVLCSTGNNIVPSNSRLCASRKLHRSVAGRKYH